MSENIKYVYLDEIDGILVSWFGEEILSKSKQYRNDIYRWAKEVQRLAETRSNIEFNA